MRITPVRRRNEQHDTRVTVQGGQRAGIRLGETPQQHTLSLQDDAHKPIQLLPGQAIPGSLDPWIRVNRPGTKALASSRARRIERYLSSYPGNYA